MAGAVFGQAPLRTACHFARLAQYLAHLGGSFCACHSDMAALPLGRYFLAALKNVKCPFVWQARRLVAFNAYEVPSKPFRVTGAILFIFMLRRKRSLPEMPKSSFRGRRRALDVWCCMMFLKHHETVSASSGGKARMS